MKDLIYSVTGLKVTKYTMSNITYKEPKKYPLNGKCPTCKHRLVSYLRNSLYLCPNEFNKKKVFRFYCKG